MSAHKSYTSGESSNANEHESRVERLIRRRPVENALHEILIDE